MYANRVLWAGLLAVFSQSPCFGAVQITSIDRGVVVDGIGDRNGSTGVFDTQLSNTDLTGTASAVITSLVEAGHFVVSGSASEYATELDKSFDTRAEVYFDVQFLLTVEHAYEFSAFGGGSSDSEHWQSFLTFSGPSIALNEMWNSVGPNSGQVQRAGILNPGEYQLSVNAYPTVFGGLDAGWAESFIDASLTISPVPEPAIYWAVWSVAGFLLMHRGRTRTGVRCA